MSTPNHTYALRCLVPVAAIALSVTTAFASGLWTVKSFSLSGNTVQPGSRSRPWASRPRSRRHPAPTSTFRRKGQGPLRSGPFLLATRFM
jgi:hypothetical protein